MSSSLRELSKKLSRELNPDVVCRAFTDGEGINSIAKRLGFKSSNPISDILKSRGLLPTKVSIADYARIISDYLKKRETLTSLARKYGVRIPDVKHVLFVNNIQLQDHTQACKISKLGKGTKAQIAVDTRFAQDLSRHIESYINGKALREISITSGAAIHTVKKLFTKNGVKLRSHADAKALQANRSSRSRVQMRNHLKDVAKLTGLIYEKFTDLINPLGLPRGMFSNHLDHIYPKSRLGIRVKNPANIWEICHPANLRLIPCGDNLKKHVKLEITRHELRQRIKAWNEQYLDPYFISLGSSHLTYFKERHGIYNSWGQRGHTSKRRYYQTSDCA